MTTRPAVRRAHMALATFVAAALLLRLGLTIFAPDPAADDPGLGTRLVRFVSYFTIESNLAVLLASVAVVRGWSLTERWQRSLRLASLVGITVTGVVYVVVLSGEAVDRSTASSVANIMLHYLAPPLTILVWLAVGPWPRFTWSDVGRVLLWAVVWGSWSLVHGAITDWYPYGFVDVLEHGYGQVAINFVGVVLFATVLGGLFTAGDRWRARGASSAA